MPALLPDEALQQFLVVGNRPLPAQVQRDDHVDHRYGLRGGPAEDELLVVVGDRQPCPGVSLKVGPHAGHRFRTGRGAAPRGLALPGHRFAVITTAGRFGAPAFRHLVPQPYHPGADADQPQAAVKRDWQRFVACRGHGEHVACRPPDSIRARNRPGDVRRQVHAVGCVTAEELPAMLNVAEPGASRRAVQGEILVAAEQRPVQPGDLLTRAVRPLAALRRPEEELTNRHHSDNSRVRGSQPISTRDTSASGREPQRMVSPSLSGCSAAAGAPFTARPFMPRLVTRQRPSEKANLACFLDIVGTFGRTSSTDPRPARAPVIWVCTTESPVTSRRTGTGGSVFSITVAVSMSTAVRASTLVRASTVVRAGPGSRHTHS